VLENRSLRSNSYNVLLACLAFTDLLVGLIVQPAILWRLGCLVTNCQMRCLYTLASLTGMICITLTMTALTMASMERYLAIEQPYFYCRHVTSKRAVTATFIACVCTSSVLLGSRLLLRETMISFEKVPAFIIGAIHATVLVFCAVKVQITARRQRRKTHVQVVRVQASEESESNAAGVQKRRAMLQEYKRAMTMNMLVLATFVWHCVIIITAIIETIQGSDTSDDYNFVAPYVTASLINLQSLANPLTVSFRMSVIRKGVKRKLLCNIHIVEPQEMPCPMPSR